MVLPKHEKPPEDVSTLQFVKGWKGKNKNGYEVEILWQCSSRQLIVIEIITNTCYHCFANGEAIIKSGLDLVPNPSYVYVNGYLKSRNKEGGYLSADVYMNSEDADSNATLDRICRVKSELVAGKFDD